MSDSIVRKIQLLRGMSVGELREEWERLYGEPTRSRNKDFLFRRLAWRVQELSHGGLSDSARTRIDVLAPEGFQRARTPSVAALDADHDAAKREPKKITPIRDARRPTPGTVLTRVYHGREIRVATLEDGFEWEGGRYGSLSAVAKAVTGQKWNGWLFFGLTQRKR